MDQEKIGKFIQEKRKEKGLTQEQLSNLIGVSKNAVSKWERGICLMDLSLLKPLSQTLNVSLAQLISGGSETNDSSDSLIESTVDYSIRKIKKDRKIMFISIISILLIIIAYYWFFTTFTVPKIIDNRSVNCKE
jgi:transcriptional regulator with XRE-family HTH domain